MEIIKNGGFVKEQIDNINANFAEASTGINAAQTAANNAQTAAEGAQSTANAAQSAAGGAQTTANEAKTAAQNAQNTADSAATAASNAQSAADNAQSTAAAAQTTANEAKSQAQAAAVSTIAIGTNAWTNSGDDKVFTTAANGKKPLAVMRKNGTNYNAVLVDIALNGTNIVITSSEAFEGYIVVA